MNREKNAIVAAVMICKRLNLLLSDDGRYLPNSRKNIFMTIKPNIIAITGDKIKERTILPIPQKLRPIAPVENENSTDNTTY